MVQAIDLSVRLAEVVLVGGRSSESIFIVNLRLPSYFLVASTEKLRLVIRLTLYDQGGYLESTTGSRAVLLLPFISLKSIKKLRQILEALKNFG